MAVINNRKTAATLFEAETENCQQDGVVKYVISHDGHELSYRAVINLWQVDSDFRDFFTSLLGASTFEAFRWETPPITIGTVDRNFEFVLVDTPAFVHRASDRYTFTDYFTNSDNDDGVVSFVNIGGDATLVVPSPRTGDDSYGHLASFVRAAPEAQIDSMWRVLGQVVASSLSQQSVWISTAGGGVAWLHIRLDSQPKYYAYAHYRSL